MSRDLKRGLYQLTVKDNLPEFNTLKSWNAILRASAPMRLTESRIAYARYMEWGQRIEVWLRGFFTAGGTATSELSVNIPVLPHPDLGPQWGSGYFFNSAMADRNGHIVVSGESLEATIYNAEASNLALGTASDFCFIFSYLKR
jgi:hypothetical protein